jgi:hypothetical protein
MKNRISHLYKLNGVLSRRVWKNSLLYSLLVAVVSIVVLIFMGVPVLTKIVTFENKKELGDLVSFSVLVILIMDFICTALRFQSKSFLEPVHLSVFPVSRWQKLILRFIMMISDMKIAICLSGCLVLVLFFIADHNPLAALISVVFWIIFVLTLTALYLMFHTMLGQVLVRYRQHLIGLSLVALAVSNFVVMSKQYYWFSVIPFTGFVGKGLYALMTNDVPQMVFNLMLLFLCFLFSLSLLIFVQYRHD